MDESHERDDRLSPHPQAEGVRIIRAEEAQAALEAGQAEGRRPDHAPRFGDVPPPPSGPRSPHRFPLPDSVDPASAVPRPAIKPPERRFSSRFSRNKAAEPTRGPSPPRVVRLLPPDAEAGHPDHRAEEVIAGAQWGVEAFSDETEPGPSLTEPLPVGVSGAGRHFVKEPAAAAPWSPSPAGGGRSSVGFDAGSQRDGGYSPGVSAGGPPEGGHAPGVSAGGPGSLDVTSVDPPNPPRPVAPHQSAPEPRPAPDLSPPEEGINVDTGSTPDLPHWTDPPTGEVPFISSEREPPQGEELAAWQALGSRGLRWRDEASDWDDLDDVSDLVDEDTRLGALDTTRTEHSDVYSFDEQFERLEDERSGAVPIADPIVDNPPPVSPVRRASGRQPAPGQPASRRTRPGGRGPAGGGRDLQTATVVGVGMLLALCFAYVLGAAVLMLLATVIVTASALELYNLIQHRGFRPATLLGVCATVAVMLSAYWRGEVSVSLILALVFITSMLWYMLRVVDARPVVNIGLTVMTFVWVGVFGSYASLLLRIPHGKQLLLLAVLVTVAADVAAYFAGSSVGSRPLAPAISPGKTWEGVIAGGLGAIIVSIVLSRLPFLKGTWSFNHALLLGVVIAVVAPLGDLCESMVKRDLDLKDSGSFLPGHGGLLDRFDALLFVLPATYYLVVYLKLG